MQNLPVPKVQLWPGRAGRGGKEGELWSGGGLSPRGAIKLEKRLRWQLEMWDFPLLECLNLRGSHFVPSLSCWQSVRQMFAMSLLAPPRSAWLEHEFVLMPVHLFQRVGSCQHGLCSWTPFWRAFQLRAALQKGSSWRRSGEKLSSALFHMSTA